jgi:hypothetical protein
VKAELTPDQVFIIRFWAEPEAGARSKHWRARVRVLSTGKEFHADGIEETVRLVRSVLRKAGLKK